MRLEMHIRRFDLNDSPSVTYGANWFCGAPLALKRVYVGLRCRVWQAQYRRMALQMQLQVPWTAYRRTPRKYFAVLMR
ncbi:MAG: hypothetical protein SGJ20_17125 [Planctomycetota bacterium]|nr:hypothetical protein [Planctomycetota bacterium]